MIITCSSCGSDIVKHAKFCMECGNRVQNNGEDPTAKWRYIPKDDSDDQPDELEDFLERFKNRISNEGYQIYENFQLEMYKIDLLAATSKWEITKFGKMNRVFIISHFRKLEINGMYRFSSVCFNYGVDNRDSLLPRGFGGSLFVAPVAVTEQVDPYVAEWILTNLAPKHWAAFEFPVIVSLEDRRVYYSTKTPVWGMAYYSGFRQFIELYVNVWEF